MTDISTPISADSVTLTPSYKLSIAIIALAAPLLGLPILWPSLFFTVFFGGFLALLGVFLLYQTTCIRLLFTSTALEVRRNENLLKTFPYAEWESWTVFWPPVPILFYFKEVNSIHFLPMLFSPEELRDRLQEHCPDCAV